MPARSCGTLVPSATPMEMPPLLLVEKHFGLFLLANHWAASGSVKMKPMSVRPLATSSGPPHSTFTVLVAVAEPARGSLMMKPV